LNLRRDATLAGIKQKSLHQNEVEMAENTATNPEDNPRDTQTLANGNGEVGPDTATDLAQAPAATVPMSES